MLARRETSVTAVPDSNRSSSCGMVDLTCDSNSDNDEGMPSSKKLKTVHIRDSKEESAPSKNIWQPFYLTTVLGIDPKDNKNCLSIRDIFCEDLDDSNPIESICLMNYMYDFDWLVSECPVIAKVPTFCLYGVEPAGLRGAPRTITSVKVQLQDMYGTHHSKMALITYRKGLRVAIITCNFIASDWTARTEGVYVQDFPRRSSTSYASSSSTSSVNSDSANCSTGGSNSRCGCQFQTDLVEYLSAVRLYGGITMTSRLCSVILALSSFDFSSAEVVIVGSVPGRHKEVKHKWGILKLAAELERHVEAASSNYSSSLSQTKKSSRSLSRIAMQFSSIGSMGKNGVVLDNLVNCMASDRGRAHTQSSSSPPQVDLFWPSVDCVRMSLQGYVAGGSLPCAKKNMYDPGSSTSSTSSSSAGTGTGAGVGMQLLPCFRGKLREWDGAPSGRQRATPHMKCYFRYRYIHHISVSPRSTSTSGSTLSSSTSSTPRSAAVVSASSSDEVELDWFVLTSSNLSGAAWGVLEKGGSQMHIRSYELGVLFLPSKLQTLHRVFSCTPQHAILGMDDNHESTVAVVAPISGTCSIADVTTTTTTTTTSRFVVSRYHISPEEEDEPEGNGEAFVAEGKQPVFFPVPFLLPSPVYDLSCSRAARPWVWDMQHPHPDITFSYYSPN